MEILLFNLVCPLCLLHASGTDNQDFGVKSGFGANLCHYLGQRVIPAGRVGSRVVACGVYFPGSGSCVFGRAVGGPMGVAGGRSLLPFCDACEV